MNITIIGTGYVGLGVAARAAGQQALATLGQLYAKLNRNRDRARIMRAESAKVTKL